MNCQPEGLGKPTVWKDEDGWVCDQAVQCRKCWDVWSKDLVTEATWPEAVAASSRALPRASRQS